MTDCIFCKIVAGTIPSIKIHEDDLVVSFMDIHPLRRGHVLTIPKEHQQQLHLLPPETRAHLVNTVARIAEAVYRSSLKPDAVHYAVNDGPAAEQTVPHVHMHLLPRYKGDRMSFMMRLLRKPFDLVTGPVAGDVLMRDADAIRAELARVS
ncbi:MAG: HIT family protein [bacterium]|nr:HIT family protein [bacterium]